MPYTPTELEAYVRQRAPDIAKEISAATQQARHEADLVAAIERILERFAKNFDVTLHLDRERTLINGRADAVYNRFVIEYEPPRSLRKDNKLAANQHAIGQVKQYLGELERLDRHRKERLAGVAFDGCYLIFVRYRDGHWHVDDPLPVNTHSVETFLHYLLALSTELAVTPENLQRDFGENSNVARQVMPALYRALATTDHPKVEILFRQWHRQFSEITGYEKGSGRLDLTGLAKAYAIQERKPDAPRLFFALHTYYATFIKLLAVQVAQHYLMPPMGSDLAAVANGDSVRLHRYLAKLERGGVLADFGIKNFVEGDFFGWYLDIWNETLDAALRRLIGDLANYSLVTLDVDPEETRDLLKQLYQNLMPRKLRHALGEYYTPDWLAERVLNQLGYRGDPGVRLLDPACGSGTFLVLAIKRVRQYAEDKMLPPAGVLDQILTNVVGFDLNPLAVISARTNYLLALGELLPYRTGDINIPVYLADSILTPSLAMEADGQRSMFAEGSTQVQRPGYSFQTAVGRFTVPTALVTAERIDGFAELLEDAVGSGNSSDIFTQRLGRTWPDLTDADVGIATALFERLAELDRTGINGIWARIIKNAFAPLFQGRFDLVAGNPPWVNWESLPEDYRQETVPLWAKHDLFPHKGFDAILGKAKDDISILMTYVAIDQYLKQGGRLGFVITQSVFKTSGAGRGFRRFRLGDGTPLAVLQVDDMSDLKPFEGAANRTAVVVLERGRPTRYPLRGYNLWYKPDGGSVIPENLELDQIVEERIARQRQFAAKPVDADDPTSPWMTARPRALGAIAKALGPSKYRGRKGITASVNGVFWVEVLARRADGKVVVRNFTDRSKRDIDDTQAVLEPDLLYPLLQGREVNRWRSTPSLEIVVPHVADKGLEAIPEQVLQVEFPNTFAYLQHFEAVLRSSGIYRRYFRESSPFYSMFNVGSYTFAAYKLVFREISSGLTCCVVGDHNGRPVIPDHKLVLCPFSEGGEAHFVCGILNSSTARFVANSYSIQTQFSTHLFENIAVPTFDPASSRHQQMSVLSEAAHAATAEGDEAQVQEIESQIDQLAAHLWGLTDEELKEIQESLAELG
jgi:SAM-dependent methyltransferase